MGASKPAEKALKPLLATVLALSLCPLAPAEKAQADEACRESGELIAPVENAGGVVPSDADGVAPASVLGAGFAAERGDVTLQADAPAAPIVEWMTSGTCRWMIDAGGCLTIEPLSGAKSGELSGFNWLSHREDITSLVVKGNVRFGSPSARQMFYQCSNLATVDLTGLDTSLVTDISQMFEGCKALKSADLSGFDTSQVDNMAGLFDRCESLESVDLSGFDTSQVVDMSSMFSDCYVLASLDVSSFDTSQVTDMSLMFSNCEKLTSLDVSAFDTSQVTGMYSMFFGCESLLSLDVSNFNTSQVTTMFRMFSWCESLKTIDLSCFDTSQVTTMERMFEMCSSLASLNLSGFNTSQVTNMFSMFSSCPNLVSLDLSSFDTSKVENMYGMFDCCLKLASLDLSNFDTSQVTNMSSMFFGCRKLVSLNLSSFDTSKVTKMTSMFSSCDRLQTVVLGSRFAFEGAGSSRLCSLSIPNWYTLTGRWVSSADGKVYEPKAVPSNVAATYTAEVDPDAKPIPRFPDVDYSPWSWYADGVTDVAYRGLITGYTDGEKAGWFGVGDTLTRGQLATILWRNACPDEYASYDPETAVDTTGIAGSADGMYYTAAANWAVARGVITGIKRADGTFDFDADGEVTFEQMVTILGRLCATPGELEEAGSDLSGFADGDLASDWSRDYLSWAVYEELVTGYDEPDGKYLRPHEHVARERAAVVLARAFDWGIME